MLVYYIALKKGHNPDLVRRDEPNYLKVSHIVFPLGTHQKDSEHCVLGFTLSLACVLLFHHFSSHYLKLREKGAPTPPLFCLYTLKPIFAEYTNLSV